MFIRCSLLVLGWLLIVVIGLLFVDLGLFCAGSVFVFGSVFLVACRCWLLVVGLWSLLVVCCLSRENWLLEVCML